MHGSSLIYSFYDNNNNRNSLCNWIESLQIPIFIHRKSGEMINGPSAAVSGAIGLDNLFRVYSQHSICQAWVAAEESASPV